MNKIKINKYLIVFWTVLLAGTFFIGNTVAQTVTVPYQMTYTAKLTDSSSHPITTAQTVRFSLWTDSDFVSSNDLNSNGTINGSATNYANWQETHTVTPDQDGIFSVQLGSITPLPQINNSALYLQVDVKPSSSPATSFEVLDPDGNINNTTDRKPFTSVPYSINADTVDFHSVGNNPLNIPALNSSGVLDFGVLPDGVNQDTFIIDQDNTVNASGSVKLQFGRTLDKYLEYDRSKSWFNFNDRVNISGGLTINGAAVGPNLGNKTIALAPEYPNSIYKQPGPNSYGKLEIFNSQTGSHVNYYKWTTQHSDLNELDLIIKFKIPEGFQNWQSIPMQFYYNTLTSSIADNYLDIVLLDTNGNPVTLNNASHLVSNSGFVGTNITFSGSPVFDLGKQATIKVKMYTTDIGSAMPGKVIINYFGT